MKKSIFITLLVLFSVTLFAQNESGSEKIKKKKNENYKPKKSWSIGAFGGNPIIFGDVNINPKALGYGINIQKAFGHSLSLRLQVAKGFAKGVDRKYMNTNMVDHNPAFNGGNSSYYDYSTNGKHTYFNFKTDYLESNLQLVYNFDFQSFRTAENPKFNAYLFLGGGALIFNSSTDQLNNSFVMHDFNSIYDDYVAGTITQGEAKTKALELIDGDYETPLEGNPKGDAKSFETEVLGGAFLATINGGLGMRFKLSPRVDLAIEGRATYTKNDLIDGQRWERSGIDGEVSRNDDIILFTSLGINIRLGKLDNVYWFDNPSAQHYKVTLENKRKVALLSSDVDNDGVSDYFDKDLETPEGVRVGVNGVPIDSDNDGIPDYQDANPFSDKGATVDSKGQAIDSDGDGVPDHKDLDNNTKGGELVNFQGKSIGKRGSATGVAGSSLGFLPAIFFDFDNATLRTEFLGDLATIANALKYNSGAKLQIIGYTDNIGSAEYNKALGLRRAQAVVSVLEMQGITKDRIEVISKGEAEPLTDVKSGDANRLNRRVQFKVIETSEQLPPPPKEENKTDDFDE